jgi:hypothetical protein
MSLFDSASLVVTPNGVKEGKLYSIKPTDGSGDLSVTRATTATRVNSAGLVEVVPYNLLTYSEQFDDVSWLKSDLPGFVPVVTPNQTISPDGTNTADKLYIPAVGVPDQFSILYKLFTSTNITYTSSIYMKGFVGGEKVWIFHTKDGINYQRIACDLTTEWKRFDLTALVSLGVDSFSIGVDTRDSLQTAQPAQNIYIWGAQLVSGSSAKEYFPTTDRLNVPRIDYTNGTCPSILVEQQRTNNITYSEQFDNAAWLKLGISITANNTTSPDGTANADLVTTTNAT